MASSKKSRSFLLLFLLLFFTFSVPAFSMDINSQKFAIDVDLHIPNSKKVYDTQISLYRVATAEEDEMGNLHMEPIELYKDLVFDNYTEDKASILLEKLCERLQKPGTVQNETFHLPPLREERTGKDGKIHFNNLEAGVYVLVKWDNKEPANLNMLPIMVYLPTYHHQSDRWENTATIIPKFDWKTETKPSIVPDTKLPQTGMVQWPVPVLVLAGLMFVGIGYCLYRRGAEDEEK
ncbi:hypothetical protein [Faecalimonas sp.]